MGGQGSFSAGLSNAPRRRFMFPVKGQFVDQLFGRCPRFNFFSDVVVLFMAGSPLDQIETAGHGHLEISQAALKVIRSPHLGLSMPPGIGKSEVNFA
jgi:hypothetical protein